MADFAVETVVVHGFGDVLRFNAVFDDACVSLLLGVVVAGLQTVEQFETVLVVSQVSFATLRALVFIALVHCGVDRLARTLSAPVTRGTQILALGKVQIVHQSQVFVSVGVGPIHLFFNRQLLLDFFLFFRFLLIIVST